MLTSDAVLSSSGSVEAATLGIGDWESWSLLGGHEFSYPRFKDLLVALVGLRNRLIVFIRREPGNCCFTILELSDQQDIAYGESWKLIGFLASLVAVLL